MSDHMHGKHVKIQLNHVYRVLSAKLLDETFLQINSKS